MTRLEYFGRKDICNQLLEIADVYIDSCADEYHGETYAKGVFLVTLAKSYLITRTKDKKRRKPRA